MKGQQQALADMFDQQGYTNHLQAQYFCDLGCAIATTKPKELAGTFPNVNLPGDETWKNSYSLVQSYLAAHKLEKTSQVVDKVCNSVEVKPVDTVVSDLRLKSHGDPLLDLIRSHKARKLLDPKKTSVKL